MSSGGFTNARYELNGGGTIVPIKVQPETLALTDGSVVNAAPTGNVTLEVTAYARKNKRQYGIGARYVTLSWDGSPPTGYDDDNVTVPVLTVAAYNAYVRGSTMTYLGEACTVVSRTDEQLT